MGTPWKNITSVGKQTPEAASCGRQYATTMEVNKSDINKTGDLTPPIPNNVEFGAKWVQMSPFGVTTLLGVVGGGGERVKG